MPRQQAITPKRHQQKHAISAGGLRLSSTGWRVVVFCTPTGTRFIDAAELEQLTGEPVRSEYRLPGTGSPVPAADAVLTYPLTFKREQVRPRSRGQLRGRLAVRDGRLRRPGSWWCRTASPSSPVIRRSPRAWRRCVAWVFGCCSIRTRRMSAGCHRGARSSTRSRSGAGTS